MASIINWSGLPLCAEYRRKEPIEHPEPAPTDEAVVDRIGWTIRGSRISSSQSIADVNGSVRNLHRI